MYVCMYACMYACIDGWVDKWMDGWMNEFMTLSWRLRHLNYVSFPLMRYIIGKLNKTP